ncbi:MAG: PaaI family thioesterase [Acidimicrobiales bacterium]|jgi:acyl-coenzyme A thioesterase PaaI-like protein
MTMTRPDESTNMGYPRPGQVLRWMRLAVDTSSDDDIGRGLMPALVDYTDSAGALRLGAISILADYVAGFSSLRTVTPDWPVTHDMAIHITQPCPPEGELEAKCRLVRAGRNNVVSETSIVSPVVGEVARAFVTFTRLPRRDDTPAAPAITRANLAEPLEKEAPRMRIDDACGFRFERGASGPYIEFDHSPFVENSVKAIQGGVVSLALDRAAAWAAELALDQPCSSSDLHIHYLALGKHGPFQARAAVLRIAGDSVTSRVSLHDTGNGDRLLALGVATATSA